MLLGLCRFTGRISTHDQKCQARTWSRCWPARTGPLLHETIASTIFCAFCRCNAPFQSSILKWSRTIILDRCAEWNPALVLFVHTQNLGPHDLIKILIDFQFKKKPMTEDENILLFACLLFDSFFLLTSPVASLWVKWCICRGACAALCFRIPFHIFGWHIYTAYNLSYIVVIS